MYVQNERIWVEFLDQPLARLEDFGLGSRTITNLEELYGTAVRDITFLCPADCLKIEQVGKHQLRMLQLALRNLLAEVEQEVISGFTTLR